MTSRPPAVAGLFYPEAAAELRRTILRLLDGCAPPSGVRPQALVVPHAGYVYSGPTAARAYATLRDATPPVRRVALFGPTHRMALRGMALPTCTEFATPLGAIPIDTETCHRLASLPGVCENDAVHAAEHSLEVQLPFLQVVLGDFKLIPIAVGQAAPEQVADLIHRLRDEAETLIVVSTDLSHYHPYAEAQALDANTVRRILALERNIDPMLACGAAPLNGLLQFAREHALAPRLIDLCNSGDTAGDPGRVVGYCAIAFDKEIPIYAS